MKQSVSPVATKTSRLAPEAPIAPDPSTVKAKARPAVERRPATDPAAARALIDEGTRATVCLAQPERGVGMRPRGPCLRVDPLARFTEELADYNHLRFKVAAGRANGRETAELARQKARMESPRARAQLTRLLRRFERLRFGVLDRSATASERRELERIDRALSNPYRYQQEVARLVPFGEGFAREVLDAELAEIESCDLGHNVRVAMRRAAENKYRFMRENVLRHPEAYALDEALRNVYWTQSDGSGRRLSNDTEYYSAIYAAYQVRMRSRITENIVGLSGSPFPMPSFVEASQRSAERQRRVVAGYLLPQHRETIQREIERRRLSAVALER